MSIGCILMDGTERINFHFYKRRCTKSTIKESATSDAIGMWCRCLQCPTRQHSLMMFLPLIIRFPDGVSGNGPMIDVARMRKYGLVSAPKWRAWIRLHYFWDTAKQRNGGYAIYATRPKVKKDAEGYLLDATGNLIVSGDVYKRKGKRYAKKGKEPQKAWYHPQAIHLGVETQPASRQNTSTLKRRTCISFF